MTSHLTHRFWFYAVIVVSSLSIALMSREPGWVAIAMPFAFALAASVADGWWPTASVSQLGLSAERAVEGDVVELRFLVTPNGSAPTADIHVQWGATFAPEGPTRLVTALEGPQLVEVRARCRRWGLDSPEWVTLRLSDRFGITETITRVPVDLALAIHPPTEHIASLLPLFRDRPMVGEHRSRSKGSGSELAEVRDYRAGDPARLVSPRLSARRGKPVVVERHPDQASDVVIFVDSAQDIGTDLNTSLRFCVTAGLALAERHLRGQDRVGVLDLGLGVRWLPARLGRRHLQRIVTALLGTRAVQKDSAVTTALPLDSIPKTATVVALTPLLSPAVMQALVQLRSRGQDLLVVEAPIAPSYPSVDPLAELIFRTGKEMNRQWLAGNGVVIVPWNGSESVEPLVRLAGMIHARARR
ncbi:MAG: DUF58 domain-containing protein [Acidimicrobiales bacterium]